MENIEISNYLNLVNERLGKLFKMTGFNPLPFDFSFTKEHLKERLFLNQMEADIKYPELVFSEKKVLKKAFKQSIKNVRKLRRMVESCDFGKEFSKKFSIYLSLREKITFLILQDFKKVDFDECEAYAEIYALDPVMFELTDGLFDSSVDFEKILDNLEEKYNLSYSEKVKIIEEKNRRNFQRKNLEQNNFLHQNNVRKNISKNHKNEIKKEIKSAKEKNLKEVKKIKTKIKNKE